MKTIFYLIFAIIPSMLFAEKISFETAKKVIQSQLVFEGKEKEYTVKNIIEFQEQNQIYFYAAELVPIGYIIISADDKLPPIIAYSYQNKLDFEGPFFEILKADMSKRLANIEKLPTQIIQHRKDNWEELLNNSTIRSVMMQQWPPEGTTTTGGWLATNWTQSSPYNQLCPIDPVTSSRSYTGCPATAMAQILNYHKTTNNTQFDDNDDYYHNYAGRKFWIDNDYDQHGFPSFPQLNDYLNSINLKYQNNTTLTNTDKAALSFACGVAATQVYTSEGSGTFGVSQAFDAYLRFGCSTVELLLDGDTTLYERLAQNMKDSLPAHLALVDAAWSTGHNVVVDGYNTDNYFHVNFGWGGSNNGWYLLPDEMPYSLTVVEGLIVDILKSVNVSNPTIERESQINIYPNPASKTIYIEQENDNSLLEIIDINGNIIYTETLTKKNSQIDISGFTQGIYYIKIQGDKLFAKRFVVIK